MPIPLPSLFELDVAVLPGRPFSAVSFEPPSDLVSLHKQLFDRWSKDWRMQGRVALSLRWRMSPDLGFPPDSFSVLRRRRFQPQLVPVGGPTEVTISNQGSFTWTGGPLMDLGFQGSSAAGMTLSARNEKDEELSGQRITVPAGSNNLAIRFHCPNIRSVRVTGAGTIKNVLGVTLANFVNAPSSGAWEPVKESPNVPILFHPTNLQNAKARAYHRLALASLLWTPPSPVGGFSWSPVQVGLFLTQLQSDGLVSALADMMAKDPKDRATYLFESSEPDDVKSDQNSNPPRNNTATVKMPLLPVTLMAASMDAWLSLAIGTGSTEFEEKTGDPMSGALMPPTPANLLYDYMVTAEFDAPGVQPNKIQACAVATPPAFPPGTPTGWSAKLDNDMWNRPPNPARPQRRIRPELVNDAYRDDVALRWSRRAEESPYGYHVAVQRGSGNASPLNSARAGLWAPFLPTYRTEAVAEDREFHAHRDRTCPVPMKKVNSPVPSTYHVSHMDCFGRSTPWVSTPFSSAAEPPQVPSLISIRREGVDVIVEWTWNRSDRSWGEAQNPGQKQGKIEFKLGVFAPGATLPDPKTMPTLLTLLPPVVISHSELPKLPGDIDTPDTIGYRTTIKNFPLSFANAVDGWVDLVVFARATSWVDPDEWSEFSLPAIAQLADPTPPPEPQVTPQITWTATPDATNVARAVLPFPSVANATGYAVYRASETALRLALAELGPSHLVTDPPALSDWPLRLNQLVAAVQNQPLLRDVFLRVNSTLSPTPRVEAELSGDSADLWAYYVKAVSATNVESAASAVTYVAVPQPLVPRTPHLDVLPKDDKKDAMSTVAASIFTDRHADAIELWVTRNRTLTDDTGKLGPPQIVLTKRLAWSKVPESSRIEVGLDSKFAAPSPLTLARSWRPYYLCARAISSPEENSGFSKGQSAISNVAELYLLPHGLPDLVAGRSRIAPPSRRFVSVLTSAEISESPLGEHRLEFFILASPTAKLEPQDEWILHTPKSKNGRISRGPVKNAGRWTYELSVPMLTGMVLARLTDPGGRVTEVLQDLRMRQINTGGRGSDLTQGGFNRL